MDQPVSRLSNLPLADRIKSDDEQVLKGLYQATYQVMERYIVQHSGSVEDAKDTYQEAFLAVWRNVQLGRFIPNDEGEFAAYLTRVTKNKWIDELRKNSHQHRVPLMDEHQELTDGEDFPDGIDTYITSVRAQYRHLGSRCRELLGRFYFRKQSLREIAALFGWTEATAKNNKYRCLKQLRERVLKEGANE